MGETGVVSLTASSDGQELVCGTRNGKLWRLLTSDLTATLQSISHTGEVTDAAFGTSSDQVCTVSDAGEVYIIDLSDYMPVQILMHKSPIRTAVLSSNEIIVGHDDGFIRCWQLARGNNVAAGDRSHELWHVHAHRGGVSVVRETPDFICTG